MSSVTIGSLVMSRQAATILVAGLVATASMMLKGDYATGIGLAVAISMNSYSINCMSVGHCDTYAWFIVVLTLLTILIPLLFIKKMKVR